MRSLISRFLTAFFEAHFAGSFKDGLVFTFLDLSFSDFVLWRIRLTEVLWVNVSAGWVLCLEASVHFVRLFVITVVLATTSLAHIGLCLASLFV